MFSNNDSNTECFVCRAMRSFAISGLGAGLGGVGALWFGATQMQATYWALGCAVVLIGIVNRHTREGQTKAKEE